MQAHAYGTPDRGAGGARNLRPSDILRDPRPGGGSRTRRDFDHLEETEVRVLALYNRQTLHKMKQTKDDSSLFCLNADRFLHVNSLKLRSFGVIALYVLVFFFALALTCRCKKQQQQQQQKIYTYIFVSTRQYYYCISSEDCLCSDEKRMYHAA